MGYLGLLKRKEFWNKGYGIAISADYISNKVLSHNSNSKSDSGSIIWDWLNYGHDILHKRDKKFRTKNPKFFWANSYVFRSYKVKDSNRVKTSKYI